MNLFILIFSCNGIDKNSGTEKTGLAMFEVHFTSDSKVGTEKERLENSEKYQIKIDVYAVDCNKEIVVDYHGTVETGLQFGQIISVLRAELKNGVLKDFPVEMKHILGNEKIVVHELAVENTSDSDKTATFKKTGIIGVSETIFAPIATISEIQSNNSGSTGYDSNYNNRNVTLKGKIMVVTAVAEGGFYLAQTGVEDYSSIYLYTYSSPYVDDPDAGYTIQAGTLIEEVNGSVFDFFGFTELSFPTFKPFYKLDNGKKKIVIDKSQIPEPFDITEILSDGSELEKKESAIVIVKNTTVAWFNENDASFAQFGQFPVKTELNQFVMAQTFSTVSTFDPVKERDASVKMKFNLTGVLKQHISARPSTWIIVPRTRNDIEFIE